jgi:hypothetical protein
MTMSKECKADAVQVGDAVATGDLSRAIEGSVEKGPGEEVRSVRLYEDNYRCNWWMRDTEPGPAYLNVGRITKSKFLRATMTGEKLVIEDLSIKNVREK